MSSSWVSKDYIFRRLKSAQIVLNLTNSHGWWRVVTPETNADSISTDVAVAVAFDATHSMLIQFDEFFDYAKYAKFLKNRTRNK